MEKGPFTEAEEEVIRKSLETIWQLAVKKFGDPGERRPAQKITQVRSLLNSAEQVLLGR